ncbi:MAG: pantoate--beta-alanine ligase [Candidatus Aminicenantes bacterium]|nr:pantoate--beta-alanine ligase [Candidatus Aminicenantes bacterium]
MKICRTIESLSSALSSVGQQSIGFVPTMGFLHAGHLSLVEKCRQENDLAVVSIYVNPAQFAPNEDLNRYPRDPDRDIALLEKERTDLLFMPDAMEIYPPGYETYIRVEGLEAALCGKSRPRHFRGVATVVLKLFNLVGPQRAYFGQKDAQQAIIILRMVRDLHLPVQVRVLPIVRDSDGLAMSSRNVYLTPVERRAALHLPKALGNAAALIHDGVRDDAAIKKTMADELAKDPLVCIDYIAMVRLQDLADLVAVEPGNTLIAAAVHVGKTRLIDNLLLGDLSC